MSRILPFKGHQPQIDRTAFIAPGAVVIGETIIGPESGIWFGSVVRGDVNDIRIGARTNIQDNCTIHVSSSLQGTYIGDHVTVGHSAILHACTVEDEAFIGMQACVMDGAKIESRAMVAAGALVTPGKIIKSGQLWGGSPARYMRDLTEDEFKMIEWSANHYADLAKDYGS